HLVCGQLNGGRSRAIDQNTEAVVLAGGIKGASGNCTAVVTPLLGMLGNYHIVLTHRRARTKSRYIDATRGGTGFRRKQINDFVVMLIHRGTEIHVSAVFNNS